MMVCGDFYLLPGQWWDPSIRGSQITPKKSPPREAEGEIEGNLARKSQDERRLRAPVFSQAWLADLLHPIVVDKGYIVVRRQALGSKNNSNNY